MYETRLCRFIQGLSSVFKFIFYIYSLLKLFFINHHRSSKQAQELATSDIIFLQILIQSLDAADKTERLHSQLLFLQGQVNGTYAGCIPHIVHIARMDELADVRLVIAIEYGSLAVASGLYDIFYALQKTRVLQMQNDVESLRPAFDKLDGYVRQELDALKRAKYNSQEVDANIRKFSAKWDVLRRKYTELFRSCDKDLVVTIESNLPAFMDALKELFRVSADI